LTMSEEKSGNAPAVVVTSPRLGIYQEIEAERFRQDQKWGGASHDDGHSIFDWADVVDDQVNGATAGDREFDTDAEQRAVFREYMLRAAAVAIASVESCDRAAAGLSE
jgi:hypothetical protein